MTPEQFCYWLQGFIEIGNPNQLNKDQIEQIKNHLSLVLTKVTPDLNKKDPNNSLEEFYKKLNIPKGQVFIC